MHVAERIMTGSGSRRITPSSTLGTLDHFSHFTLLDPWDILPKNHKN